MATFSFEEATRPKQSKSFSFEEAVGSAAPPAATPAAPAAVLKPAPALKLVPPTPAPAAPVTGVTPSAVAPPAAPPPAPGAAPVTGVTPPAPVAAPDKSPALAISAEIAARARAAEEAKAQAAPTPVASALETQWPVGMNPKWVPDKKGSRTGPGRLEMYGKDAGRFNSSTEAFASAAKQTIRLEQKASAPAAPAKIDLPPPPVAPPTTQAARPPLSLALPGGERKTLTSYPNPQLTGDQYLENLEKVKPADGKSVLQNVPPAQSFSMVTPEFVKKFEQTFADLPLEQRLAKLKTFTTPETPYAVRMAAQQILARVTKENQRTPSRDATSGLAKLIAQSAPVKAERGGGADQTYKPVAFPEATPHFADDQTPAEVARQNELMQIISGEGNALAKPNFKPATPDRNINDLVADTAISLGLQAPVGFAQSVVGLADLVTGNLVGDGLQAMGVDFTLAQKTLDLYKSESLQQAKQRVGDAKGFTNAVIASIANPSATVDALLQSAPAMLASIAAARYFAIQLLRNAGLTAGSTEAAAFLSQPAVVSKLTLAGSAAAGAQAAGSIQERGREAGRDYLQTAPSALGAGVVTAGLGFLTSKIPGFADAEAKAATAGLGAAQRATLPAAAKAIGATTGKESLEESSQSASEKAFSNLSLGKPVGEGVPEAAGQGVVAGGATGAGLRTFSSVADAIQANKTTPADILAREIDRGSDAVDELMGQFKESPAQLNPNLLGLNYGLAGATPIGIGLKADTEPAGRAEPTGKVDISKSPGRAEPAMTADELLKTAYPEPAGEVDLSVSPGRPDPEMTVDELVKIVSPETDQKAEPEGQPYLDRIKKGAAKPTEAPAPDEEMVSLDEFAVPSAAPEIVTPVTPTTRAEYVAEVRRQLGDLQPGDVLENDQGDVWTVDDVIRNKAGEITQVLPRERNAKTTGTSESRALDLDGIGSILLPSPYTDLDGNRKMSQPGSVKRAQPKNVSVTPVTPETPTVTPVTPASYAADIAKGIAKNTPEDVQFYANNATEIEAELRKLAPKTDTVTPVTPEAPAPVTPVTAKAKARPGARQAQGAYERNPFLTFLARKGLYHEKGKPNSQKSEFSPDRSIMVPGFGPVFKKTGMLPDVMVQSAIEDGYLPFGATESDLTDLIRRAVSGERIAPLYAEGVADEEMARRIKANREANQPDEAPLEDNPFGALEDDPFGPLDNEQIAPQDSAITNLRQEVSDLLQEAEGLGIDVDTIKERTNTATQGGTESDYLQAVRTALADAIATPKLDLKSETPQETVAREATQEADQRAADQKKQADNAVDFFELESQTQVKPEAPTADMFADEAGPSAEYQAARELANRAGAAFRKVQEAYRKQEIGDDDFLAGRKVYDTAMAAFDKAFKKEQDKPTETKAADKKPAPAYTPEQRAEAETHAKETGGTIVWQEGDYALIRGFSVLSGDPVYVPTIGSNRGRVDIASFTGKQIPDDIKKKMLEVKQDLEEKAALKHANDPFIVFDGGMAFSSDISGELAGVVRGWKDLLKLKPNIYISTVAAATENKDNFTGPHRRIGSATLDSNDRGSTRRMKDGSHYIVVTKSTSPTQMLEIIAHELGHIHEKEYFNQASQAEKDALKQAHATWVNSQKGKSAEELVASLRGRAAARTMLIKAGTKADDLNPYWTSFGEWYADQTSRWAVTAKSPVTVVEKFFKRLALQLRLFYQRLHNAKYLPNETFVKYIEAATGNAVDLTPQDDRASKMSTGQGAFDFEEDADTSEMISSNNPVVAKTLNEVSQTLPKAQKKLPPGRSPELAAAAQMVQNGTMTAKEYDALVNKYRPIPVYSAPLVPATTEQVFNALDSLKRQQVNPAIPEGTPVGLRLDIPSWNRSKTFVVSIHQQRPNNSSVGAVIGYASTAAIKNVTFALGNQKTTLKIATGQAKDAIQTMEGTYVPMTPAETLQRATEAFKSGEWVQVGIDVMRHSYFFDRRTTLPVIKADEVLQIGNMILAKGVTFGSKDNFLFNLDTTKPAPDTSDIRAEKIKEFAKLRARLNRVVSKVAKGDVSIDVQRDATRLLGLTRELKEDIGYLTEPSKTPARFLSKALAEYDLGNISPEVLAVIEAAYNKTPWLLDGLRLSVRASPGKGTAASFATMSRIVALYKETSGVEEPKSIRHELTHSLEQMMTVPQRRAVIDAWLKSMQRAIKNNPDQKHQTYFQAVMDHMENPTEKTRQAAIDALPSYSMYQFINPSEFWAVNAESLMGQQLGAYWERFKKSMRTLLEGLKQVLGFDNRYAIHKTFNDIMSGSKKRLTTVALADYVTQNQDSTTLLENQQDDEDLLKKHQQPHTPMMNAFGVLKNFALKAAAFTKDMFKTLVNDPKSIPDLVMTEADRSLTFARNKLIWFGSGLNNADRIKYGGELLTAQDMATASLALDNALRGGSIAVQVLFQGGIKFDPASKNFVAVKTPKGMTNVYKAQAELKKKLGDQLGEDIIQSYLEAKRSRSIKNEEYDREQDYELLKDELKNLKASPAPDPKDIAELKLRVKEAAEDVKRIKVAASKVTMSDEAMDDFIALEAKHPELRTIMDNWGALNQNLLKLWLSVGLLSKGRYDVLSGIKDYVPWQRIMTDEEDIHSPIQTTSRTLTNIGKEKLFKDGTPRNIIDFVAEAGQQKFKIQPSSIVYVKINGNPVAPTDFTFTPSGEVTINVPITEGDLVVFDTKREIENIIDNMTRNAMRMVMNGIRQYAALRIVKEYATRDEKNKIMVFPGVDEAKGRFSFIASGQRIVVEIKDSLIAEAIFGMESMHLESLKPLAIAANFTRRTITLSGAFQIKQVFKDAPTAAFVTGVKNPAALLGGVYKGFVSSLLNTDPVVDILTQAGIGGFVSAARTPEADIKRRIGTINSNIFDNTLRVLDHIGDASDMAQRVAIYKQVMADTGNAAQALYQANNVINFRRHGASTIAQFVTKTVPFANATAQSIDVLAQALTGGGLRGMERQKALGRLLVAGTMLSTLTLLYCFAVGDDDDYEQLDDQTKLRNFMIPGTKILLPMNTGAAFFFKAIPELLYNAVMKQGTNTAMDMRRMKRALGEAARDMLLGPEPIPSALKPIIEIGINYNFFTGRPVTPQGVENKEKAEQYTASTSELAKMLGSKGLSPIEIDHLIRGLFGSAGAMAQWSSNVIGQERRPESTTKDLPIVGAFVRPDALRGREDLFYDLAADVKIKYGTWKSFIDRDDNKKANEYLKENGDVVELMRYVNQTEADLSELNEIIRYYGETTRSSVTPETRRKEIARAQGEKNRMLKDVYRFRKDAGF